MTPPVKTLIALLGMTFPAVYGIQPLQYPGLGYRSQIAPIFDADNKRTPFFNSSLNSQLKHTDTLVYTVFIYTKTLNFIIQG